MSIKDAKHIPSWQIGFEDGIKFALKIQLAQQLIVKPEWKWAKLERPKPGKLVWLKFEGETMQGHLGVELYHITTDRSIRNYDRDYAENNGLMWREIEACPE